MLERLLGIIYVLLNRECVTAGELAERFEVSVRTIYRDVESLSMAGIPVYTRKGKNGGISLTQQFVLDKRLVTENEQQEILSALVGLQETGVEKSGATLRKLGELFGTEEVRWVSIDFSDWSGRRTKLYETLKEAILKHKVITFDYYGQYGEMSQREVEPLQLLFKEYTWYLKAFCRKRQRIRLFKVLRMKRVLVTQEDFALRAIKEDEEYQLPMQQQTGQSCSESKGNMPRRTKAQEMQNVEICLLIDKKEAYRIYDRFDEEEITVCENGDFEVRGTYFLDDWVYGMILSFGPSAVVLEPDFVREEVKKRLEATLQRYGQGDETIGKKYF